MTSAHSLLGLCSRAGRLASGEEMCLRLIRSGGAKLMLVDAAASANTRKEFADACRHYGVPLIYLAGRPLGEAIGKPGRMSAAVTDPALAERIQAQWNQDNTIDERGGAIGE